MELNKNLGQDAFLHAAQLIEIQVFDATYCRAFMFYALAPKLEQRLNFSGKLSENFIVGSEVFL